MNHPMSTLGQLHLEGTWDFISLKMGVGKGNQGRLITDEGDITCAQACNWKRSVKSLWTLSTTWIFMEMTRFKMGKNDEFQELNGLQSPQLTSPATFSFHNS